MKKKLAFAIAIALSIAVIALVATVSYIGTSDTGQRGTHFRITAIVDVKGQSYSAATVQSYTCPGPFRSLSARAPGRCRILGEALDVQTPEGSILFLLRSRTHAANPVTGNTDELARNISRSLSADGELKAYLGPQLALITSEGLRLADNDDVNILSIKVVRTFEPVEYDRLSQSITANLPDTIKPYDLIARY